MAFSILLIQSYPGLSFFGGLCGNSFLPRINAAMPNGTLIRNSQCHEAIERMPPAIVGPDAVAIAMTMALSARPRPRTSRGYIRRVRAILTPITHAAPTPWIARATIIIAKFCDNAHSADAY